MPKETPENPAPDETTAPPEASPPEAPEVEAAEDNNADAEAQPQSDTAALQAEVDALNDKLLRSMADYQNLARRSQINVQQAREQALSDLAKAMIKALDHFDLALQVDPEKTNARSVLDGVTMVRDELLRTLGQFEITRIDVNPGDEFDPNRHEALMRAHSDDIPAGCIVQQLQPGWAIKDRVIRAAQVSLAN